MSPIYGTIIDIIIWILFFKGLVLMPITGYLTKAFLSGQAAAYEPISACVAGTFAFSMSCVVIFIKHKML